MMQMTFRHLRSQGRQLGGIAIAIALSIAFLIITQMVGSTLESGLRNSVGRAYQNIDLSVTSFETSYSAQQMKEIDNLPGVAGVQTASTFSTTYARQGSLEMVSFTEVPSAGALRDDLVLDAGEWPGRVGEMVLHKDTARTARLNLGDTLEITLPGDTTPSVMTLSGVWSGSGHFGAAEYDGFLDPSDWAKIAPELMNSSIYVTLDQSAPPEQVTEGIIAIGGTSIVVDTRSDLVQIEMNEAETERRLLELGISTFALLTLVVAALVISNTFAILIAQRSRDIALLRCAGATTRQVKRLVLSEAAIIGLLAAIAGLVLAVIGGEALLRLISWRWESDILPPHVSLPTSAIPVGLVAGVVLAVGAAWIPARGATQIDPLVALRASQAPTVANQRSTPVRTGIAVLMMLVGLVLMLGGIALSGGGQQQYGTLTGIVGGTVSFGGVIVGASLIVPKVARILGGLTSRLGGVPARVAATNGVRNPRRTTSTAMALVIGVTLVTMMSVGAESLRVTLLGEVDGRVPVDFMVEFNDESSGEVRAGFANDLAVLPGVETVATFGEIEVSTTSNEEPTSFFIRSVDPAELSAVWRDSNAQLDLEPGTVLAPQWVFDITGLTDGDEVTLAINGTNQSVVLHQENRLDSPLIAVESLSGGDVSPFSAMWVKIDGDTDEESFSDSVYELADQHGVVLQTINTSDYRNSLESALDTMLLIVVGLLAVAVVISLIGVSNTLSLSVLERTRESALLRALGFTRRQLRQSLAIEGVFLAAIGSVIGILLGVIYGWIGTLTLVGNALSPAIAIPWASLGIIAVVAVGCGLLASVLPARRATMADPVVALADR